MQKVELLRKEETPDVAEKGTDKGSWSGIVATLPGIGMALLPNLSCPACWPAYAGILSSLGLGFVNYSSYLLPLTALFLILAVASLGFRAKKRRGYGPFILGSFAALTVVTGKFILGSEAAQYAGIAMLTAASLWNSWPRRKESRGSCSACASWDGGGK
jgi:hypothetical protein